jgi:hypothetical protein
MNQTDPKFIVGFGLLIVILLAAIMLAPHPILPERSTYLTEEQELQELRDGRIVLLFFYNRDSALSEIQGEIIIELEEGLDFLVVEWINMDEYLGDLRVTKVVDKYKIEATPSIVIMSLHHEKTILGGVKKTELLVEINKLRLN